ncbi:MAG: Asp-tRNA(Asn)/Glu-tRNA(Gln) amidotransferase subunit GatB [Candidatus Peregrinibacteria bacterium]|nr:Asp-tRNA(Asn)/Glu-tRNA(Gln) amidotransferase subunit GatB [Candidatus Peregrinibacteria bacterium]MDZ4245253.1 Asp-tRNA(Asn)/Glu-tRNA(Gln) amidotransferase subunit GatB [Candidatus Gracilibacteria bacterium]
MSEKYEVVVGLEIHAQCNTKSKMFCGCDNDSFGKEPNINTCPICMGFPGMLPVVNAQAVQKGIKAGLALGCKIPRLSQFDRKNYFYPDLPKAYQITQFDEPVAVDGEVEIELQPDTDEHGNPSGDPIYRKIGLERLHLEEDAGKLTHTATGTLCDYNRSSTPLMEIVSKPDMRSIEEASAYAREVQRIVRYVGASDADMEKGMMRFDINVSLRPFGQEELGTKVEVKNVNSFRSLERALAYEIKRQSELLDDGKASDIVQETRGWDDERGTTESQRTKEGASDYRYFPEPDLPPLIAEESMVRALKAELPELPVAKKKRFMSEYDLNFEYAGILTNDSEIADFFEEAVKVAGGGSDVASKVANMITNVISAFMETDRISISDAKLSAADLGEIVKMMINGEISSTATKEVIEEIFKNGGTPNQVVESKGLKQVSDTGLIDELCKKVIEANPSVVEEIKSGKPQAIGFLVGQVMKDSKGQANPAMVSQTLIGMIG